MGILFLPSLKEKKFFEIHNVSKEDAIEMADTFTTNVMAKRKIKDTGNAKTNFTIFENLLKDEDTHLYHESDFLEEFAVSETRGTRGARIVFVDLDENVIGIGNTVVFNSNWATINFDDSVNFLKELRETFSIVLDEDEEEEESESNDYHW